MNLTGQQQLRQQIAPHLQDLKQALDLRAEVWARLPFKKKKKWVLEENDPIMNLAVSMIEYFVAKFPDIVEYKQRGKAG